MREFGEKMDRRGTSRFPLREGVRYRLLNYHGDRASGSGSTLNMGSGGILFTTEDWPAQLNGNCPLKFVAVGRVIRSQPGQAAVRIERYEFKTRGKIAPEAIAAVASTA